MKRKMTNEKLNQLRSYLFEGSSSELDEVIDLRLLRDGLPLGKLDYL